MKLVSTLSPVQPMSMIEETFLEADWDDASAARTARDQRAAQLQELGFDCSCENLYTVFGQRVFLLTADRPDPPVPNQAQPSEKPRRSVPNPKRSHSPQRHYQTR